MTHANLHQFGGNTMRTFSIRLEDEDFQVLEINRGDVSRSDYVREVLIARLHDSQANRQKPPKTETVTNLEYEIQYLQEKVDTLLQLLNQEQILHLQTQRQLPTVIEMTKKKWWQFWKG